VYNDGMATRQRPDQTAAGLLAATARCLAEARRGGVSVRAICAEAAFSPGC
jgi:hypothetical protein